MMVRVDAALRVGHGRCYALGPDVFQEDERGHCQVERGEVPLDFENQARRGEANCPEGAIHIEKS